MSVISAEPKVADDLRRRLDAVQSSSTDLAGQLQVLAAESPESAAEFLSEWPDQAGLSITSVGPLADRIVSAAMQSGVLSPAVLEVARRHFRVLGPDTLEMVLSAAGPDVDIVELLDYAVGRYKSHAGILRVAVQRAVASRAPSAHDLLTRLGRADTTLGNVNLIRRLRAELPDSPGVAVRAAFLSSYTIDPLLAFVDLEVRALGLRPELYLAPFNSWTTEMLAPASGLREFAPDVSFLSVAVDDLVPELSGMMTASELEAAGDVVVSRVMAAVDGYFSWSQGLLVVHGMHTVHRDPMGVLAGRDAPSRSQWIVDLNAKLAKAVAKHTRCYVLDMTDVLVRRHAGALDNPKMRHLASMRLNEQSLPDLALAYARYIAPLKGLTKKCVVLDLDNTLWGGVIGEDGPHGIHLGHASPGAEFQEFQRFLQALMKRGVLLAIASKNNPDDALEVIRNHSGMILREADFAAVRINWRPKPENVASLAEELNIGVDSLVFVDDNPDERELMRQLLPQVMTVEMPRDPARYRETLEALPQLQALAMTKEDAERTATYRANRERAQTRVTAESLEAYLASLEIVIEIEEASPSTLPRVHQLFHRTNQFNVTTRRYDVGQLGAMIGSQSSQLLLARARDKFGDHGIVAVALAHFEGTVCTVDSFLMSCRIIGYGVESALLAEICRRGRESGATIVEGDYIPTPKNPPARDFFERHGFERTTQADGSIHWQRSLSDGGPVPPTFFRVDVHGS